MLPGISLGVPVRSVHHEDDGGWLQAAKLCAELVEDDEIIIHDTALAQDIISQTLSAWTSKHCAEIQVLDKFELVAALDQDSFGLECADDDESNTKCLYIGFQSQHVTPSGLRSLDPDHPDYRPRCQGDVWSRDSAYHQGTVWAWLLGHFALAEYRAGGNAEHALSRLEAIPGHLKEAGLGTVSEIFDGDAPHTPRGCPAQAWSVACILEAWWKLRRAQAQDYKNTSKSRSATSV